MSATGEETYKLLEETAKTPEDRIYKLPQNYQHIKQKYFYLRENLVMMLKSLPEDEKTVIFVFWSILPVDAWNTWSCVNHSN